MRILVYWTSDRFGKTSFGHPPSSFIDGVVASNARNAAYRYDGDADSSLWRTMVNSSNRFKKRQFNDDVKIETIYKNKNCNCFAVTEAVVQALVNLVSNTKGNCVTLTSRRLICLVNGSTSISHLLAKRILNALADMNLIVRYNEKKGKYILCSNSQLWKYLKADDRDNVTSIINKII